MITYDFSNASESRVGEHGLSDAELDEAYRAGAAAFSAVLDDRKKGRLGFAKLPAREDVAGKIEEFASRSRHKFYVHIGIGGSSLGAVALHQALAPERRNLHFLDNVDPEETAALFDRIDPKETLFHIVTKSGTTAETVAGLLVALDRVRSAVGDGYRDNFVVTTGTKGFLRDLVKKERLDSFEIPVDVGGRFSALSAVGLLPAALAGIPIREVMAGAVLMDETCAREDARKNPAFTAALVARSLDSKGKHIHVLMPYARALASLADWFQQLWAESLGKDGIGPTPVRALGVTDQHSQIQLYNDGPPDKFITFLETERFARETRIPEVFPGDETCAALQGRTFSELMLAEKRGTEAALTKKHRPNATIRIPEVGARTVGALLQFFEMATAFAGPLYGVNPYDQPGVEAGKKATREFLSGAAGPAPDPKYVVS